MDYPFHHYASRRSIYPFLVLLSEKCVRHVLDYLAKHRGVFFRSLFRG